ncbi:hypothetical protein LY78DRAFT_275122 [Colletotrichum sublineola]|nr:hypothetical protein LY78DRAFT_275122 [Colletotrichum sublineola]
MSLAFSTCVFPRSILQCTYSSCPLANTTRLSSYYTFLRDISLFPIRLGWPRLGGHLGWLLRSLLAAMEACARPSFRLQATTEVRSFGYTSPYW